MFVLMAAFLSGVLNVAVPIEARFGIGFPYHHRLAAVVLWDMIATKMLGEVVGRKGLVLPRVTQNHV